VAEASEPTSETTKLGSYEIVRKLARGGMAEVYLARSGDKLVVLKKILPRYANNSRYVQLFLDEAKLAASLDHPHIVKTFDMGMIDGQYYFAMEYVHGQDVRSILRRSERTGRKVPIALVVKIARTVAEALHYAHERRRADGTLLDVVHRDVSPSNILVSYDGAIKLADFGVAKASSSSVRTRTGTLKGKVGYMSPEQARGAMIDRRSDIFSLGVVLWELVAIRRLFKSDNDLATIQAIIHFAPPPLTNVRSDCPAELAQIIERALQKDRDARYQSAEQVQMAAEILGRVRPQGDVDTILQKFLGELFDVEIAAWREAQSHGHTVTDFVISHITDLTTPISASGIEELSFDDDPPNSDDDDDLDDDDDDEEQLPPRAGQIDVDQADTLDGDDATVAGPPPVMVEGFEGAATQIDEPPFSTEESHTQAPTLADSLPRSPQAPQYPPTGEMEMMLRVAPAIPAPAPTIVDPSNAQAATSGLPIWETIDLAPWRKWILIGAGVAAVLLVLVVILAIVDTEPTEAEAQPEPAPTELPAQPSPTAATPPAPAPSPAVAPAPAAPAPATDDTHPALPKQPPATTTPPRKVAPPAKKTTPVVPPKRPPAKA
jgi:serine/threonine protein kinase